jgi:hypothetical protein
MSAVREVLPGVTIAPQVIETAVGPVEVDLTEGEGPVVLANHAGLGGVDQARVLLSWLDLAQCCAGPLIRRRGLRAQLHRLYLRRDLRPHCISLHVGADQGHSTLHCPVLTMEFFCRVPTCPRRIVTERLAAFVASHARRSHGLRAALRRMALAIGGEGGVHVRPLPPARFLFHCPIRQCPEVGVYLRRFR